MNIRCHESNSKNQTILNRNISPKSWLPTKAKAIRLSLAHLLFTDPLWLPPHLHQLLPNLTRCLSKSSFSNCNLAPFLLLIILHQFFLNWARWLLFIINDLQVFHWHKLACANKELLTLNFEKLWKMVTVSFSITCSSFAFTYLVTICDTSVTSSRSWLISSSGSSSFNSLPRSNSPWGLVVNTFKRSTAERVPSECSQVRYTCDIWEYLFKSTAERVPSECS